MRISCHSLLLALKAIQSQLGKRGYPAGVRTDLGHSRLEG